MVFDRFDAAESSAIQRSVLILAILMTTGCASDRILNREQMPHDSQIAEMAGCRSDEVAVCIEINCEPEEFQCAPRDDVRKMFKAGEFRH